jgi:hypothetical protein
LGTNATNDTLAPYSGTSAARRAAHLQDLGFNQIADYHYSIVTADWAKLCSILNNFNFKLHHTHPCREIAGGSGAVRAVPPMFVPVYLASERM